MTITLWLSSCPPGIDPELWAEYTDIRKRKKYPLTETALNRLVAKVERLTDIGYDGNAMFTAACDAGWRSIWPVGEPKVKPLKAPPAVRAAISDKSMTTELKRIDGEAKARAEAARQKAREILGL